MPRIQCECGRCMLVAETQAGQRIRCACGQELIVPNLRALRRHATGDRPVPASPAQEPVDDLPSETGIGQFVFFLTDQSAVNRRISMDAVIHYIAACDRFLTDYFAALDLPRGIDLEVSCAVLPESRSLVDVHVYPDIVGDETVVDLIERIERMPSPAVAEGNVAFVIRKPLGGGGGCERPIAVPFSRYLSPGQGLEDLLGDVMEVNESRSRGRTRSGILARVFWSRVRSWFKGGKRRVTRRGAHPESAAVESNSQTDEEKLAAECTTVEQVGLCLGRYPDSPPLLMRLGHLWMELEECDRAISAFSDVIDLEPGNSQAYAARAGAHCALGNTQPGLIDYTAAIELDAGEAAYFGSRGLIFLALDAWARAEQDFSAGIALAPIQPRLYVDRARSRIPQQDVSGALQDLATAIALDPYSEQAYALRGWLLGRRPNVTTEDIDQAVENFTRALEIESENSWYHAQRGEAYASLGKFALAIEDCTRAIELDATCTLAYGVRGYAHQQLDNFDEALADCTQAIERGMGTAAVFMSRAVAYGHQGDVDQAIADCNAAIEAAPDYAVAFNYRGVLHLTLGDIEQATEDFAEAAKLAPEWAMPHGHRGNAHRMRSEYELAIEEYTRTIELEPTDVSAYANRALTWIDMKEYDKALEDLEQLLQIDDEFAPAYYHRAELMLLREQYDSALEDLNRAITADSEFAQAYYARAHVHLHEGNHESALRDFDRLIELCPTEAGAFVGRANLWLRMGEHERASEDYHEALNLEPGSADDLSVHRLLAEAQYLHEREDYEAAIAKATEAIEWDAQCVPAYATRAADFWYSEQRVEAVDDYNRVIELAPDASFAYAGRGQVYAEMGEYQCALEDLNRAVQMMRDEASSTPLAYALNGRALAHAGLEQYDQADHDFEESLRLCPDNAWAHYNRALCFQTRGDMAGARDSFQQALQLTNPPLTKRKRKRAEAFLRAHRG